MRPALLINLFLLLPRISAAQESFVFADVGWHATPDSVRRAYASLGLEERTKGPDGDLTFGGMLFDYPAAVIAQFVDSGLAHVDVILDVPDGPVLGVYEQLLKSLSAKYGPPPNLYKGWFAAGMHQNGVYRSTWPIRGHGQPKPNAKNVESFQRLDLIAIMGRGVHIEYVSEKWPAELERRKSAKASPF